ncbi:hypothetical protein C5167_019615 [Papaver somniferum]|uniref:N-acetyltransferase domain-containing protein n=1 Tax=Papaver somniferum TaxID=3469 RepID=A0A4Y7IQP0_PAPSO|nr:hypothetical protein C5167_019615 [Papaver somniferum]
MRRSEPFMCVIVVRKEGDNALNGMLKNVIGTLDFRFKYMLQGETYPEPAANLFSTFKRRGPQKHGIISNIIVAKSARQQGIKQVYLHVCRDNKPALALYRKMGFGGLFVQLFLKVQNSHGTTSRNIYGNTPPTNRLGHLENIRIASETVCCYTT